MLNPVLPSMAVAAKLREGLTGSPPPTVVAELLRPGDILLHLDVPTKERALEDISRFVAARHGLVAEKLYASLVEREKVGSTGLGQGLAIPHARVPGLSQVIAAFARTADAIPFDAPDGKPVSDLLVILVSRHATEAHLSLLAAAAEMFCNAAFRERLRACADAAAVHAAFTQWSPRD